MRRAFTAIIYVAAGILASTAGAQAPEPMAAPMMAIPEQVPPGMIVDGQMLNPPLAQGIYGQGNTQPFVVPAPLFELSTVRNARGEASYPLNLLPTPSDPNDIQVNDLLQTVNIRTYAPGGGDGIYGAPVANGTAGQIGLQGVLGFFYDTGFAGGGNSFQPALIAVDGTADAHRRGQFKFLNSDAIGFPLRLQLGTQTPSSPAGHLQSYVELTSSDETGGIEARRAFLRTVDDSLTHSLALGKLETIIGDAGAIPTFITPKSRPIGGVGINSDSGWEGIAQVRYAYLSQDAIRDGDKFELGASIEDQNVLNDVVAPTGGAVLQRFPSLGSRVRYQSANQFDSYQLGVIVRPLGVETAAFDEDFATGWGVSALGRIQLWTDALDALYFGVVGGDGTGAYIWNGTSAASFAGGELQTLSNFGAFAAYQRYWWVGNANENLSSNFVIGYVDGTAATADANRTLHQAAINLLWNVSATTGLGVEYQYGQRELGSGASGDDHRLVFGVQFSPAVSTKGGAATATRGMSRDEFTPSLPVGADKSQLRL